MENLEPSHLQAGPGSGPVDGGVPSSWTGTQEEPQASQPGVQSMYCKDLVSVGDTEFSFEELRAQRYYKQVNEKVQHLSKVKEDLKFQIEQKQKLVLGRSAGSQYQRLELPKLSPQNADVRSPTEPEMSEDASIKNGQVSQDDDLGQGKPVARQRGLQASKLFSIHNENSLPEKPNTRSSSSHKSLKLPTSILKSRKSSLECPSDKNVSLSRPEEAIVNGHWNKTLCRSPDDTGDFVRAAMLASTPFGGPVRQPASERATVEHHESLDKTATAIFKEPRAEPTAETKKLSPIQEISHEWGHTSVASICTQELESKGRATTQSKSPEPSRSAPARTEESAPAPRPERVNPCSLEVRKALLDKMDLSSLPDFSRNVGPLPEHDDLYIDGETLFFLRKLGDGERYLYCSGDGNVLVKVDTSTGPWDFYISSQMRSRLPADQQHCHARSSCHLYENGSITLWKVPQGQTIQELLEDRVDRRDVPLMAVRLMEMVKRMHSCRLVHGALQPETLMLCYSCDDSVMGVDFSGSVDLDLQPEVKKVQDLPCAQKYIDQGLLSPSASPFQVDLCGVAEIVHLLLAGRSIKINKEGSSWKLAEDSGLNLSEPFGASWENFFHNVLNPEDVSTETVLNNLINNLKNVLYDGLECPLSL